MEYWFLFPVGVVVAVLAMSSGVSGSNFWIPIYLLWMHLEPRVAFWTSLLTMLFGFGSGMVRNIMSNTVHFLLVWRYFRVMAPATVIGALLSPRLPVTALLLAFAGFVIVFAAYLLYDSRPGRPEPPTHEHMFWGVAGLAGFLHGGIATGSGTLMLPCLLGHRRLPHHADAVGTTVTLAFVCSVLSVAFRVDGELWSSLLENRELILSMIVFSCPGVVIGGQIGPLVARKLPRSWLRRYVAVLLIVVGTLVALRAVG